MSLTSAILTHRSSLPPATLPSCTCYVHARNNLYLFLYILYFLYFLYLLYFQNVFFIFFFFSVVSVVSAWSYISCIFCVFFVFSIFCIFNLFFYLLYFSVFLVLSLFFCIFCIFNLFLYLLYFLYFLCLLHCQPVPISPVAITTRCNKGNMLTVEENLDNGWTTVRKGSGKMKNENKREGHLGKKAHVNRLHWYGVTDDAGKRTKGNGEMRNENTKEKNVHAYTLSWQRMENAAERKR